MIYSPYLKGNAYLGQELYLYAIILYKSYLEEGFKQAKCWRKISEFMTDKKE